MKHTNIMEYWSLVESLQFPIIGVSENVILENAERIRTNTDILQKAIQISPAEVAKYLIEDLRIDSLKNRHEEIVSDADELSVYSIYSLLVLRKICSNVDFHSGAREDLVSERHKSIVIAYIEDIVEYGIKSNLNPAFYRKKGSIFRRKCEKKSNFYRAELMVEAFSSMVHVLPVRMVESSDEVILCYMAAIFTLILTADSKEYLLEQSQISILQMKLQRIWTEMSKVLYYRNLMLLYGMVPAEQQQIIHREMLLKLWSSGGFVALLFALQKSERDEQKPVGEVVIRLVTQRSYSPRAQQSLVKQILRFLNDSVRNTELMPYMGVGLISLRKMYDNNSENKDIVKNWLKQQIRPLLEVKEGCLTVMEWGEFTSMICLLFQMFCTSAFECLPSEILVCYFPILISCHHQISSYGNQDVVCSHLSYLILKILNNRSTAELEAIIKCAVLNSFPQDWLKKHPKVVIVENILNSEDLRIVQAETESESNTLFSSYINSLAIILKNSSFNTLSYQIFITLFRLIPTLKIDERHPFNESTKIEFLVSDEDIQNRVLMEISRLYNGQIQVVNALQILIQHKPIRYMILENIKEILTILQEILATYTSDCDEKEVNKSVIMILLVLIKEIVESALVKIGDVNESFTESLKQLKMNVRDKNLKYQISALQNQIQGECCFTEAYDFSKERFEEARSLIESNESYVQVEGIEKFITLIKVKDAFTISSIHVVTALALNTLKSTESYTFLNCVRLFASLVYINEYHILEILSDDYLNDSADIEYRLLVGEALLKVCKELGQLCYKYKALLLNTFMCGCRSTLDEFRYSSYSNLAQLCRLLTSEVHNFFEELLHLINCELTTGKYIPAKRAAVMVLSDLLAGINNLFDYEEVLLPIYRLLKLLVSSENCDEKIRLHASVGLENITVKCKELLLAVNQHPMKKDIKIMGISDNSKRSLKNHILYMN